MFGKSMSNCMHIEFSYLWHLFLYICNAHQIKIGNIWSKIKNLTKFDRFIYIYISNVNSSNLLVYLLLESIGIIFHHRYSVNLFGYIVTIEHFPYFYVCHLKCATIVHAIKTYMKDDVLSMLTNSYALHCAK